MSNKENKVLWLSQEETIQCGATDMSFIFDNVERANLMSARNESVEAPIIHMLWDEDDMSGKRIGIHGVIINSETENVHVAGVKSIPSNPMNPMKVNKPRANGLVILYDNDTGYPLAVLDETCVSAMRTGAGAGLGAKYLANPDAKVMGLIGCGAIASCSLQATVYGVKSLKMVKVYDINRKNAERFCKRWEHLGLQFEVVDSPEAAVRGSDIVEICTNASPGDAYVEPEWIKPGSFQCEVSCWDYKPESLLLPNAKYGMDMVSRTQYDLCTLSSMIHNDQIKASDVVQLSDVMLGKRQCRTTPDDIVFYYTMGMCITDIYISYLIYRKALKEGLGTWVYQWKEPALL